MAVPPRPLFSKEEILNLMAVGLRWCDRDNQLILISTERANQTEQRATQTKLKV